MAIGTLCRHTQPRGTGDVGDTVPAAAGAARAVCHPGYQANRAWADPDNPRVKIQGSVCLPSTQPQGPAAFPCPRAVPGVTQAAGRASRVRASFPRACGRSDGGGGSRTLRTTEPGRGPAWRIGAPRQRPSHGSVRPASLPWAARPTAAGR